MSKKPSPTLIGVFTLLGIIMAGGALILLGAGKFFERSSNIILYFDQSANGLLIGSEVRFGGVRIGRVTSIQVLVDSKENRKIIPVLVELSEKSLSDVGSTSGASIDFATETGVKQAVNGGLRARMKQQSLLTGQLYIEFDIVPDTPGFIYLPDKKSNFPTVPTMGTEIDELITGVADGLKKFNALDLETSTNELRDVLATAKIQIQALDFKAINDNLVSITSDVRSLTSNEKLTNSIDHLDDALAGMDLLTQKANQKIDPLMEDFAAALRQASFSMAKIDEATSDLAKVTNPRAPTLLRIQNVLEEVERTSRSIKDFANDLKRNPDALLRGKAPIP